VVKFNYRQQCHLKNTWSGLQELYNYSTSTVVVVTAVITVTAIITVAVVNSKLKDFSYSIYLFYLSISDSLII